MSKIMEVLKQRFSKQVHDDVEARESQDKIDWCDEMDKKFTEITGVDHNSGDRWAENVSDEELKNTMIKAIGSIIKEHKLAPLIINPTKEELEKAEREKIQERELLVAPPRSRSSTEVFRTRTSKNGDGKKSWIYKRRE